MVKNRKRKHVSYLYLSEIFDNFTTQERRRIHSLLFFLYLQLIRDASGTKSPAVIFQNSSPSTKWPLNGVLGSASLQGTVMLVYSMDTCVSVVTSLASMAEPTIATVTVCALVIRLGIVALSGITPSSLLVRTLIATLSEIWITDSKK